MCVYVYSKWRMQYLKYAFLSRSYDADKDTTEIESAEEIEVKTEYLSDRSRYVIFTIYGILYYLLLYSQ